MSGSKYRIVRRGGGSVGDGGGVRCPQQAVAFNLILGVLFPWP